jgi:hypothetical protein
MKELSPKQRWLSAAQPAALLRVCAAKRALIFPANRPTLPASSPHFQQRTLRTLPVFPIPAPCTFAQPIYVSSNLYFETKKVEYCNREPAAAARHNDSRNRRSLGKFLVFKILPASHCSS